VRLEVEARSEHTWVVVDDPVPAGASVLGGGLGRDSALLTAGGGAVAGPGRCTRSAGSTRTGLLRAGASRPMDPRVQRPFRQPRSFELPATRVEALYAPEVFAEAPNAPVVVEAAP